MNTTKRYNGTVELNRNSAITVIANFVQQFFYTLATIPMRIPVPTTTQTFHTVRRSRCCVTDRISQDRPRVRRVGMREWSRGTRGKRNNTSQGLICVAAEHFLGTIASSIGHGANRSTRMARVRFHKRAGGSIARHGPRVFKNKRLGRRAQADASGLDRIRAAGESEKKSRGGNEASRSLSRSGDAGYTAARYIPRGRPAV